MLMKQKTVKQRVWKILKLIKNRPYKQKAISALHYSAKVALHKLLLKVVLMIVAEQEVFKGNSWLVRELLYPGVRELTALFLYDISIYYCKLFLDHFNKDCAIITIKWALHQTINQSINQYIYIYIYIYILTYRHFISSD